MKGFENRNNYPKLNFLRALMCFTPGVEANWARSSQE